jgi:hypothetical protein
MPTQIKSSTIDIDYIDSRKKLKKPRPASAVKAHKRETEIPSSSPARVSSFASPYASMHYILEEKDQG